MRKKGEMKGRRKETTGNIRKGNRVREGRGIQSVAGDADVL